MTAPTNLSSSRPTGDSVVAAHVPPGGAEPAAPSEPLHRMPGRRPPVAPSADPAAGSPVFPARLFDRPSGVFVYGTSRAIVNLTLFTFATHANPGFHWVEIGSKSEAHARSEPVRLGWIPPDRLWLVDPPEVLRPDTASARLPIFDMIRSDEPSDTIRHILDFLRLPDQSQRIIGSQLPNGRPGVVAVTNAHRAEGTIPPDDVPAILSVHRNAGFSVMVGYPDFAGPARDLFDFVFRIQGIDEQPADWKKVQLVCEKGITAGPLRDLRPLRLEEIPILAEVLSRARPSS